EIAGEGEDELEMALHELTRKELVRPSRTTSMDGESEYSFWHILVRDVAYSQIPRAERARRHRAAAAWIERKAGERVEDLAEVLAHHYLQAIELFEAAGEHDEASALAPPARRFLALAGERALGLDTGQAPRVTLAAEAVHLLEQRPPGQPLVDACAQLAGAHHLDGEYQDAIATADRACELAHTLGLAEPARALGYRGYARASLGDVDG